MFKKVDNIRKIEDNLNLKILMKMQIITTYDHLNLSISKLKNQKRLF